MSKIGKVTIAVFGIVFLGAPSLGVAQPKSVRAQPMRSLEACYLEVAAKKSDPNMAQVAKSLCDEIFAPRRKSLVLLSAVSKMCEEWWLDSRGRYQSSRLYCAFGPWGGEGASRTELRWELACQYKDDHRHVVLQKLREKDGAFEVLESHGESPGRLFSTLGACVKTKAK